MRRGYLFGAVCAAAFLSSCGDAISEAQVFKPNIPPVIETMSFERADGKVTEEHNILCDTYYTIHITAADPEGKPLSWRFASDFGSFSTPVDTQSGCVVTFVTDMPKGNTAVIVTLAAIDEKDAVTEKSVTIGYGKPLPKILNVSAAALTVGSAAVKTFTVRADCEGTFQVYCDNSITSERDAHIDETKSSCIFGYDPSAADPVVSVYGYSGTASGFKLRLPQSPGTYKVWIVFRDKIEQEDVMLCTVTEG